MAFSLVFGYFPTIRFSFKNLLAVYGWHSEQLLEEVDFACWMH